MAKNNKNKNTREIECKKGDIKYKMSEAMADAYLKGRKGEDKKKNAQEFLCNLVNTQFGIKGNCVEVLFF
jgi:hypothetical protein